MHNLNYGNLSTIFPGTNIADGIWCTVAPTEITEKKNKKNSVYKPTPDIKKNVQINGTVLLELAKQEMMYQNIPSSNTVLFIAFVVIKEHDKKKLLIASSNVRPNKMNV
jgi:hypothetical protein